MGIFNFRGEEKKESWMTEASEHGFRPSKRNFLLQKYTRCHLVWIHMLFLQKLQKKKKNQLHFTLPGSLPNGS